MAIFEASTGRRMLPPAGRPAEAYRIVWGLFFLAAAVFNAVVTIPAARDVLRAFADLAWPGIEMLVRELMLPVAASVIGMVVAFEAVVGALILSRGSRVRWGLWASLVWLVALIPFLGAYGLGNLVLASTVLVLLRRRYDRSLRDVLFPLRRRPSRVVRPLAISLCLFTGASAVYGGVELLRDGFGLPTSWLEGTWFGTWTIPGVLLVAFVAVPMLVAAGMLWRRAFGAEAAMVAGAMLAGWIIGQMAMVRYFFLQPVMLLVGLAVAGLAYLALERAPTPPLRPGGNGRQRDPEALERVRTSVGS
jgi:hypothetical protein